ncbi:pectinesterase family protein, partial [Streptomyces sp. NPDC127084]|uniref:pectinesterase family protein n=1 Tax=Streptomyces sp. NPDC127084 TaxID=3347133 RepID=UPI00364E018D
MHQDHTHRRPRWALALIAALTSAALLAGALSGALATASSAAAADTDNTPIFRVTDDGATTANYLHFHATIRAHVDYEAPGVTNTVEGTTALIDHTNPNALGYTEAVVQTEDGHDIRMRFRTSDLYLVGWYDNAGIYHYIGPANEARIQVEDADRAQQLTNGADYNTLQRLGNVDRATMVFSRIQTEAHALSLWKASSNQAMAAAAVYFAQFISEAARFRGIQDTIAQDGFRATGEDSFTVSTTLDPRLVEQENDWGSLSERLRQVQIDGSDQAPIPLTGWFRAGFGNIAELTLSRAVDYARILLIANGYPGYSKRRHLANENIDTVVVADDGTGDYTSLQGAIDAIPADGIQYTILMEPGFYNGPAVVPSNKPNLVITADSNNAADVVLSLDRAHGMTNPATGQPYGTEGSAVLTVKAAGVQVTGITIENTFDPAKHPEVDAFSTQAVAVAAEGDRQVFTRDRIISSQDTVLAKAPVATGQYRQY